MVPPEAVTTTVPVPPWHWIGTVTDAFAVISAGWMTSRVPDFVQPFASMTLQLKPVPAEIPAKVPEVLVLALKV